jgi:hypothetical protein
MFFFEKKNQKTFAYGGGHSAPLVMPAKAGIHAFATVYAKLLI